MGAVESRIAESEHWFVGEDRALIFDVTDAAGAPQTMTGWALTWELLDHEGGTVLITKTTVSGITIGNGAGTNDRATVVIADTDTEAAAVVAAVGVLFHQLKRTDAGSEAVLTFGDAHLLVRSGA